MEDNFEPQKPQDIMRERLDLWKELGSIEGKPAAEVIRQTAKLIAPYKWGMDIDGKMKEFRDNGGSIIRASQAPYSTPEAVWLLGQEEDGVDVLHGVATSYYKGLLRRVEQSEKQMYDEEEMRFADWDLDDIIYALKTAKKEVKKERKKEKEMSQQITRAQKTDNKE